MTALILAALTGLALVAGAIAAVAGFGIGSLLTPALALSVGTKVAEAKSGRKSATPLPKPNVDDTDITGLSKA